MMNNNNGNNNGGQEEAASAAASAAAAEPFWLEPRVVRASDTSAAALDEWTGAPLAPALPEEGHPLPLGVQPLGNYAVQISWDDGFNQVAPYEVLLGLRDKAVSDAEAARRGGKSEDDDRVVSAGGVVAEARIGG
jgi:hypothetical protein